MHLSPPPYCCLFIEVLISHTQWGTYKSSSLCFFYSSQSYKANNSLLLLLIYSMTTLNTLRNGVIVCPSIHSVSFHPSHSSHWFLQQVSYYFYVCLCYFRTDWMLLGIHVHQSTSPLIHSEYIFNSRFSLWLDFFLVFPSLYWSPPCSFPVKQCISPHLATLIYYPYSSNMKYLILAVEICVGLLIGCLMVSVLSIGKFMFGTNLLSFLPLL